MLEQQIIQRNTIIKADNFHDVNLENYGARAREAHDNTDNAKLFDLANTEFGEISLWVHAKPSQRIRNGRQVLKLIWYNQLGVHEFDECNTKNYKEIPALAYHGEKKIHNWQAYILGYEKYHDVQTAIVEQEFNDFTDRKKVTFLLDGIKCNTLDSVISVVSGGAVPADFEAAQLMLAENTCMLTEHSKLSSRNFSAYLPV